MDKSIVKICRGYHLCKFIADITDEYLEVTERWLIKVSVVDNFEEDEESGEKLVSRKLVFEVIQKLKSDAEAIELCFEAAKLPVLHLTVSQTNQFREGIRFEMQVFEKLDARSLAFPT